MTKMEAITQVLEAGIHEFENGKSFSINGILFFNYSRASHMEFNYDDKCGTIYSIIVVCDGHVTSCIMARDITKVTVSYDNAVSTSDLLNRTYGRINGEEIDIKER